MSADIISSMVFLFVAAVIVERVIDVIFSMQMIKDYDNRIAFPIQKGLSMVLGVAVCFVADLDILAITLGKGDSVLGIIMAGIIISGGSNYVHDTIEQLKAKTKSIKNGG